MNPHLDELILRVPALAACEKELEEAARALVFCYEKGGKVLLCGNGGSCADCEHISGELLKGFLKKRPLSDADKAAMKKKSPGIPEKTLESLQKGLPAIPLTSLTALGTAFGNDVDAGLAFAQGVLALGKSGDVLIAISTSGNAENVHQAALTAKALGITVLSLTGEGGGRLAKDADIAIRVPEKETYKVQELHLPVYHYLCIAAEDALFDR